jgi:hypothetical protein
LLRADPLVAAHNLCMLVTRDARWLQRSIGAVRRTGITRRYLGKLLLLLNNHSVTKRIKASAIHR